MCHENSEFEMPPPPLGGGMPAVAMAIINTDEKTVSVDTWKAFQKRFSDDAGTREKSFDIAAGGIAQHGVKEFAKFTNDCIPDRGLIFLWSMYSARFSQFDQKADVLAALHDLEKRTPKDYKHTVERMIKDAHKGPVDPSLDA